MTRKQNVLFLQLPSLDNDVHGPHENIPLVGIYQAHALETSRAGALFDACFLPPESDEWDNAALVREITALRPAVIACTLYLWNVERTLRVLRQVRQELPETIILAGGPEAAAEHPLLFRSRVPDVVAIGEGVVVSAAARRLPLVAGHVREHPGRQLVADPCVHDLPPVGAVHDSTTSTISRSPSAYSPHRLSPFASTSRYRFRSRPATTRTSPLRCVALAACRGDSWDVACARPAGPTSLPLTPAGGRP